MSKKSRERRERQTQRFAFIQRQRKISEIQSHISDYDCVLNARCVLDYVDESFVKRWMSDAIPFNVNSLVGGEWSNVRELGLDVALGLDSTVHDLVEHWQQSYVGFDMRQPFEKCVISFRWKSSIYSVAMLMNEDPLMIHAIPITTSGEILRDEGYEQISYSFAPGDAVISNDPGAGWLELYLKPSGELNFIEANFDAQEFCDVVSFSVMLKALSAFNCRNIQFVDHPLPPPDIRQVYEQEFDRPMTIFKTLKIKGSRKVYPDNDAEGSNHIQKRLHLVRGHAAKYTDEAPLFGKHVGTFWIRAHVRGDETVGTVVKDYDLEGEK